MESKVNEMKVPYLSIKPRQTTKTNEIEIKEHVLSINKALVSNSIIREHMKEEKSERYFFVIVTYSIEPCIHAVSIMIGNNCTSSVRIEKEGVVVLSFVLYPLL